ncbi:MAG: hypothetical protein U1F43_13170 [Myxococcota bacterium]
MQPRLVALALAGLASACMEPLVDDALDPSPLLLPAGTALPAFVADPAQKAQLALNIAPELSGVVRVRQGFFAGAMVDWWDLGPASPTPVPGYLLVEPAADGELSADGRRFRELGAPAVLTAVPGDLGYSPLWRVILVPVTERYAGQVLASVEAIDAAVAAGIVEAPIRIPEARNWPVVLPETRLERVAGAAPEAPITAYYKDARVDVLDLGELFVPGNNVPVATMYTLRRDGGEPISEPLRGVDLTGDGDAADSNDLFATGPGQAFYSPLVRVSEAVVPAALQGIDSYHDQARSDLTDASQLFAADHTTPEPAVVMSLYPSTPILDRPFVPHVEAAP